MAVATLVVLASSHAAAATVYHETFDGPGVPGNWSSLGTLGIADDSAGIGGGNALSWQVTGNRQTTVAAIPEATLASIGDKLIFSFDIRLNGTWPNNNSAFRFGIFHDGGTTGSLAASDDDAGYMAAIGTGTTFRTFVRADGPPASDTLMFGTNRQVLYDAPGAGHGNLPNDTAAHSLAVELTRTAGGVLVEFFQNGVSIMTAPVDHTNTVTDTDLRPFVTSFNSIGFTNNGTMNALIDNVRVATVPVPEPGSVALLLGCLVLAATGRVASQQRSRRASRRRSTIETICKP